MLTECDVEQSELVDVIVIGAGAAGMMCAIEAGKRGRSVLVLDHAKAPGEKIRISGGGRCNFTNIARRRRRTSCRTTRTSASRRCSRYTPRDFIALVERAPHRLAREDAGPAVLRRLGAADHRHAAATRCSGAAPSCGWRPTCERVERDGRRLRVAPVGRARSPARRWWSPRGGKSIPKMGATGFGYDIARAVRPARRRDPAGAGAADLRGRAAGAAEAAGRRRGRRSAVACGKTSFRRGHAVHPSRPQRPGDPADLVLLARGRGDRDRPCARAWTSSRRCARPRRATAGRRCRPRWPSICRSGWRS